LRQSFDAGPDGRLRKRRGAPNEVGQAIMAGIRKFTNIPVPALAIFALSETPRHPVLSTGDPAAREAADVFARWAWKMSFDEARAFEKGVPGARVIRFPFADHYVFLSAEADVLREMGTFLAALN
jgi:non-heme chloroperoxidase